MTRDWTHRQLVYSRNALRRAAGQIDLGIERREDGIESAIRVAFAAEIAHDGLIELGRAGRRLDACVCAETSSRNCPVHQDSA